VCGILRIGTMEYSFDTIETNGPGGVQIGVWQKVTAARMCEAEIDSDCRFYSSPEEWRNNLLNSKEILSE
jgi:hypothetical protein